jgi:hypothetical protein
VVWATCYGDTVTRWDARYKEAHSVSPWKHTLDSPPDALKYRCHWTPPLAVDPFDHDTVYYGCQVVFRTTDAGRTWAVVSPDLSTQDPAHVTASGGVVGDNLGQFYGEVVFAIAPSTIRQGLIWAGTNDGQVWITQDATKSWTNVTRNLKGLPPLGTITRIDPSAADAGTAYVSVDLHLVDDRDPYIYKTTDFGKSWKRVDGDLPHHALAYVRTIAQDPNCPGLLFAGTGNGLYYSLDDGAHWLALRNGLPPSPVTWAVVQPTFHDLVVSTYGRGLYILDDITPLEQLARRRAGGRSEHKSEEPVFFEPRPAYRFVRSPAGPLNFSLTAAPKDPVKIEILDAHAAVIRTLEAKDTVVGINRVTWDLRYDSPRVIALRTAAPDNPRIWQEPRFRDADSRPITHWGSKPGEVGAIVAPGTYSARLTVDGRTYVQPVAILADPHSPGSAADIEQSVATLRTIEGDISHVSDTVNQIEWLRKQLEVIESMLHPPTKVDRPQAEIAEDGDEPDAEPSTAPAPVLPAAQQLERTQLQTSAESLDQKLRAVETRLVSEALRNSDDKYFVEPYGAYLDLIWLNAEVGTGGGDVAGSADFAPSRTQLELLKAYEETVRGVDADLRKILAQDLPPFNHALETANLSPVVALPSP